MSMKNILGKIATVGAITTTLALAIPQKAQAISFNFDWQGNFSGYSAIGTFSYDQATAPTIISASGAGLTNFLQSLNVSFYDPSNNIIDFFDDVTNGVSQYSNLSFNFNTVTDTLFGSFDVGGFTLDTSNINLSVNVGTSGELTLSCPVNPPPGSLMCNHIAALDENSGTITVSQAPEPLNILGATAGLVLFGTVSTALKRRKQSK